MAVAREFLDTNVLIYAFSDDPRAAVAQDILARGCDISVQVLNEFAHVARLKLGFDWNELGSALAERYRLSVHDASIIAAALNAGCKVLHGEDMQHGQEVEGALRISNPFLPNRS